MWDQYNTKIFTTDNNTAIYSQILMNDYMQSYYVPDQVALICQNADMWATFEYFLATFWENWAIFIFRSGHTDYR